MPRNASIGDMVTAIQDAGGRPLTEAEIGDAVGVARRTVANHREKLQSREEIDYRKIGKAWAYWDAREEEPDRFDNRFDEGGRHDEHAGPTDAKESDRDPSIVTDGGGVPRLIFRIGAVFGWITALLSLAGLAWLPITAIVPTVPTSLYLTVLKVLFFYAGLSLFFTLGFGVGASVAIVGRDWPAVAATMKSWVGSMYPRSIGVPPSAGGVA